MITQTNYWSSERQLWNQTSSAGNASSSGIIAQRPSDQMTFTSLCCKGKSTLLGLLSTLSCCKSGRPLNRFCGNVPFKLAPADYRTGGWMIIRCGQELTYCFSLHEHPRPPVMRSEGLHTNDFQAADRDNACPELLESRTATHGRLGQKSKCL